jgi:signal peptidase II
VAAVARRGATTRAGAFTRAALVLGVVLVVDQATKAIVRATLDPGESHRVLPFLHLVRARNEGIAFGALAGGGTVVVAIVAAALIGLVIYFVTNATKRLAWLPTGLLLGGALGNIIDRVRAGGVTDFVQFPHWPAFNVADMAITAGVLALVFALDASDDRG